MIIAQILHTRRAVVRRRKIDCRKIVHFEFLQLYSVAFVVAVIIDFEKITVFEFVFFFFRQIVRVEYVFYVQADLIVDIVYAYRRIFHEIVIVDKPDNDANAYNAQKHHTAICDSF